MLDGIAGIGHVLLWLGCGIETNFGSSEMPFFEAAEWRRELVANAGRTGTEVLIIDE